MRTHIMSESKLTQSYFTLDLSYIMYIGQTYWHASLSLSIYISISITHSSNPSSSPVLISQWSSFQFISPNILNGLCM